MQRIEVSDAVQPLYGLLGFKGLTDGVVVVVAVVVVTMNLCYICVCEQFYVHSTDDMPTIGRDKPHWEFRGSEQEVYVVHKQMVASPELRHLDPEQRGCLFQEEVKHHPSSAGTWELPFYTYRLCKMACRSRMAQRFCNCIPFFYKPIG